MEKQRRKLNLVKARRRVRMRSALLLTLGAFALTALVRGLLSLPALAAVPRGAATLLETACTVLAFGGGAYLGLCVLDGDHRSIVPMRRLSRAQMRWLALLGVLAVCPMALISDLTDALRGMRAAGASQAAAANAALLVKRVLIVPVCEELFFRGYLLPALSPQGRLRASVIVSLCFALMHGSALTAHAALGLLLCLLTIQTGSLLAPILVHAGCNLALTALGALGLSGLLMGWSLPACIVKATGCAAFAAVLKRAVTARPAGGTFALWEGEGLTKRETALLASAAALLLLSMIVGG
ncbi:MAG: CPBP family intramembrane metalloprotease [Clostridiales bacterium]|nr:CPBP family intramembrane metalloprotease [Clostridiales bacterium]MDY3763078.1 CPBP family intramembrane glutamic endopeptidase [Candidatus Ventricola sp.]MCI6587643.1 CPBP family intramembrane metalloprotease [Clostridiales bacterium]MDY3831407.1 CPBP family intramembrane glutamic endopeptidase [Candidatus Ventricola sp.]MDY4541255.1 CPBP family intramembrane glutamic endopeptidase [Candidatus Ventricola sp.]